MSKDIELGVKIEGWVLKVRFIPYGVGAAVLVFWYYPPTVYHYEKVAIA